MLQPPGGDLWFSPAVQTWRSWLMLGVAVAAGMILAIGLTMFIISQRGDRRTETQNRPGKDDDHAAAPAEPAAEPSEPETPETQPPTPVESETPATDPAPPQEPAVPQEDNPAPPTEEPAEPTEPTEPVEPANPPADPPTEPAENPDESMTMVPAPPVEPPPAQPPVESPPPRSRPEMPPLNIVVRLRDPIGAIQFDKLPLKDFLRLMSDMSTVPIVIQPEALDHVGADPGTPVTISIQNTTVGELLDQVLDPLGLAYEVGEDAIRIEKKKSPDGKPRRSRYSIEDLAANAQEAGRLMDQIVQTIDPASWSAHGGSGKIALDGQALLVSQDEANHFQLLVFCEKLRKARRLELRSRYDPALFNLETRTARVYEKMQTPVTLGFLRPARLTDILKQIEQETSLHVLVDWQALAEIGWPRTTETTCTAKAEPLEKVLARMLDPMELTWRAVDAGTIQITSAEVLASRHELEFHPVGDLAADNAQAERLIEQLRQSLGAHLFQGPGSGAIVYDPAGRCLIARLPQLYQRNVEAILASMRSK